MQFKIDTADALQISDHEISALLTQVYLEGGFVAPELATTLFEAAAVRNRGKLIGAREKQNFVFAGMVMVVYPGSPARRLAQGNETEMHLLAVKHECRGNGLGRLLVNAAIHDVQQEAYSKLLLSTQLAMQTAQHLYESSGFIRIPHRDFNRGGRDFLAYEKTICT